ncbi:hypothetical protein [Nitrososphaeria virus YSH_462411]|uniref:Uncharacterized protein n=1 Tax=Nitrososphaeria virus YSH_462411 TaxID=3071321 RepID=A0A976UAJ6_9CAUD|nr:hypothetical protein QKV92_gp55 [Yangshan Harbor Nitrososphaeria virus]UVF62327.1 hypothetical protein [Nitrososphaeria virus YSH_462411]
MTDVCLITFKKNNTPHMIVKTRAQAKKYCKDNPQFTWECWSVHNV